VRIVRLIVAGVLALVGLGWIGQGLGLLPGSLMSGSLFWAGVGAILIVVAVVIAARELRRSSPPG
jgi:hypothetical protein